jgi:hypothetical protein
MGVHCTPTLTQTGPEIHANSRFYRSAGIERVEDLELGLEPEPDSGKEGKEGGERSGREGRRCLHPLPLVSGDASA